MMNLKRDIIDELLRDKNYLEIANNRLSSNPIIDYREMVGKIKDNLEKIAVINGTFGLLDVYFPEPKVDEAPQQQSVEQPVVEQEVVNEPVVEEPVVEETVEVVNKPVEEKVEVKAETSPFPNVTK